MPFALGAGSNRELQGVHPRLVDVARRAIVLTPVDFTVLDGLRTKDEQKKLVASGASQTMDSKHLAQKDGFSHAVDLVPFINGKPRWEWPPIYKIAAAVASALAQHNADDLTRPPLKLRWGGCWRNLDEILRSPEAMEKAVMEYGAARRKAGKKAFTDGPHYEIVGGV